jgi:hypothetical protein
MFDPAIRRREIGAPIPIAQAFRHIRVDVGNA